MAQLLEKQKKYTLALTIYRKLLAENPKQIDLKEAVERLEKRTGTEGLDEMIATFETWIDLYCRGERVANLQDVNRVLYKRPNGLSNDDNG